MRETRAAARAQLIRASHLEDVSDANYRQIVPFCVSGHCQGATAIRGQLTKGFHALYARETNLRLQIEGAE